MCTNEEVHHAFKEAGRPFPSAHLKRYSQAEGTQDADEPDQENTNYGGGGAKHPEVSSTFKKGKRCLARMVQRTPAHSGAYPSSLRPLQNPAAQPARSSAPSSPRSREEPACVPLGGECSSLPMLAAAPGECRDSLLPSTTTPPVAPGVCEHRLSGPNAPGSVHTPVLPRRTTSHGNTQ
ncbi:hypothetical protein P7K49_027997 [Saguinus oedipus]|uniref:Uncharacterized protein n=1 Tax=Saguinus oedipus TaxID=9490 RepID=A0ABQ9UB14_SAGOE|nr:hypothetical protein P7K49_027997 [Saguinus oedipus]